MRRAHVLALVVLLGACEHGPQSTSSVDAPAPKAETTQGAPTPAAKAKPAASEVYRRPGDPATGIDELAFWGWSEDGRYFAVETYHHGADMVECEGEAELTIFDAEANRPAEDGHVLIKHAEPEAETCDPPDLREALAQRRAPLLERYGITPAHIGGPLSLEPSGDGSRWSFTTPKERKAVTLSLRVLHGTDDPMEAIDGAAFELELQPEGGPAVVLEPGRERRPWTLGYGLEQGMPFVGPQGRHAAILVATQMTMPEGVRSSWTPRGATLR